MSGTGEDEGEGGDNRTGDAPDAIERLAYRVRACRKCVEAPDGMALAHEPRPILQVSSRARLCIAGQAPGRKAHEAGRAFADPSGVRLRAWLGLDETTFYDPRRVAIVPMGFCFPGYDKKRSDLPPRPECAPLWRAGIFRKMPNLELILLVGQYAQKWHLGSRRRSTLTDTVAEWRDNIACEHLPRLVSLPHPSWRNNAWLARNPWFEEEFVPALRKAVESLVCGSVSD